MKINLSSWQRFASLICMACVLFWADQSMAGSPAKFSGTINQSVNFGISDDAEDNYPGFNQAVLQANFELEKQLSDVLLFRTIVGVNADWAYDINDSDSEWEEKGFDDSRSELHFFDDWNDILRECHFTYTPTDTWFFRVGKQVIQWGEMDWEPVTNKVMPLDYRRGYADLEMENLFIPITLIKAEYFVPYESTNFGQLSIEGVFNPNLEFRATEGYAPLSSTNMGIWAPTVFGSAFGLPHSYPEQIDLDEPDRFDSEGHEFGARIKAVAWETLIQVLYWDGLSNTPIAFDGSSYDPVTWQLVGPYKQVGYYPRERLAGADFSRELPLGINALGGVNPVLRADVAYTFNKTFYGFDPVSFTEFDYRQDELACGVALDMKYKIKLLNPKAFWAISPEYHQSRVDGEKEKDVLYVYAYSQYFHGKLMPDILYAYDFAAKATTWQFGASYTYSSHWNFRLLLSLFEGEGSYYSNKDFVGLTIGYQF